MKNLFISFSGGRTSAFMLKFIFEHPKYNDYNKLVLFANTGKEKQETLDFVHQVEKNWNIPIIWIEAQINDFGKGPTPKVVNYQTASRDGEPFSELIKKLGLPNKGFRHCTRDLKQVPMHKYAKEFFNGENYLTAIGIRADEAHRVSKNPEYIYPLFENNIDERFVRLFWEKQSFDLNLKDYEGNCDLCFLKSIRKKLTIIKENPSVADWWKHHEERYSNERQRLFDIVGNVSVFELLEKSKLPFRKVHDKHEVAQQQLELFKFDMDLEFSCFCKTT
jgi:hypothetical protein